MTTKYERGANFERRVKKHLEDTGFVCFRSAGSHSPADLIAHIGIQGVTLVMLVQCQLDKNFSASKKGELVELAKKINAYPLLAYRGDKKKIQFEYCEVK